MEVSVIGTGHTKFGLLSESLEKLLQLAVSEALRNSQLEFRDCDAIYISNFSSQFNNQSHLGALLASQFSNAEVTRVEAACASGALAVKEATVALLSGYYKTVMVVGVEKMTSVPGPQAISILMNAASREEARYGLTFPSLFGLMARAHFKEFGSTEEDLAYISVKNHYNAALNPVSHFHKVISKEDVLASKYIASPIKLLDSSPISDGAAAIVLSTESRKKGAKIIGFGHHTDKIALFERKEIFRMPSVSTAAQKAFKMAGILPKDINVAELHDCFTVSELIQMEEMGFAELGKGRLLIRNGETELTGKIPINTSGGLKAKGHPIGATGVAQIVELVRQLEGTAGKRQIRKAKVGAACNIGGSGSTAVITILKNDS